MTAPTKVAPRTFSVKQTALLCVVLALAVIAFFARVNQYPFVNYDDDDYVTDNPHVQAGAGLATVLGFHHLRCAKLASADLAFPCAWIANFSTDPAGRHTALTSCSTLNALLLFLGAAARDRIERPQLHGGIVFCAASYQCRIGGLDAERKNLLSMLFFCWRWEPIDGTRGPGSRYLRSRSVRPGIDGQAPSDYPALRSAVVGLLAAAERCLPELGHTLLKGPGGGPIPPRKLLGLILEKFRCLRFARAARCLPWGRSAPVALVNPANSYPLSMRLENAVVSYARYIGKAVWPLHLSAFYPYPRAGSASGRRLGPASS